MLLVLALLVVVDAIVKDAAVVDKGTTVAVGVAVDDVLDLTDEIVDFGSPKTEMFDVTDEGDADVLVLVLVLVMSLGVPYIVVLGPMTKGTGTVWLLPLLSVKYASPVVVVNPSVLSEECKGRLRLPMAEDGIGVPLALQAAWSGATI